MYSLDEYLRCEIFKEKKFSRLKLIKTRFFNSSTDAIYLLRSYFVWSKEKSHRLCRYIHKRTLIKKYGIFIPSTSTDIGLKLPHPQGIVFGNHVKIDKKSTVYQEVTFGGKNMGDAQLIRYPNIGEKCVLYFGFKIWGDIYIADNTIIGANAVLIEDTDLGGVMLTKKT